MSTNRHLYQVFDPGQKHPDLYQAEFAGETVRVRLRPFYIPEDLDLYNEWLNQLFYPGKTTSQPPASSFTASYFRAILESSGAQSIWGLINDEPAFGIEIYEAIDYPADFGDNIRLVRGDIMLELIIDPALLKDHQKSACILPACLGYLRSHAGSNKIVWLTDHDDHHYNELARAAHPISGIAMEKGRHLWIF